MPTYEYECTKCGHQFEIVQSMKDPHLKDCPQSACEGPVRRKIGRGAGIIFKGSGFYQTDYRSDAYKAAAKSDAAGASAPAAPKSDSGGGGSSSATSGSSSSSSSSAGSGGSSGGSAAAT